ncbi:hypothetical protein ACFFUB_08840 [Algimonas porphyrae]|uniref:Uncharacterized protein n=1 Tax=Algimonas porphyrae TaxID=1128113 RepID=A0ABQ5V2X0_9PROT|nr:hypothetical protein [Algimonas porphyrae]GLQ21881.1 hypothetical protein GCM10007854_28360 [Algimonas porphyrae]
MANKNVTLAMPEKLVADMKVAAFQQGTSMNAVIRELCEAYVGKARAKDEAREALLKLIDETDGQMGSGRFDREETYSGESRFDKFKAS